MAAPVAVAVGDGGWGVRRAEAAAFLQKGEPIEAMKILMAELRAFAERERIHELPIDTSTYFKEPAAFGEAFQVVSGRPAAVAVFSEILELRGAAFVAVSRPKSALRDLEAAAELCDVPRAGLLDYLSRARREVAALLEAERGKPRFQVGDSVVCKTGRTAWQDGDIVQLWWQHPEDREFHPYQVKMQSDQRLIFVPIDDDRCIRKIERVWWENLKGRDDFFLDHEGVKLISELSTGNNLDAQSHDGETALLWALNCRWRVGVHALLRLKADPNCPGCQSDRALNVAVWHYAGAAQAELTMALLEAKADPRLQDKDPNKDPDFDSKSFQEREWHRTALHYAAEQGETGIMTLLLEARAELNVQDAQYKMPLHLAIEREEQDATILLIDRRADISSGHMEIGLTTSPLIDAAYRDDQALMHLLIKAKANLDQRGRQGMTALHVAARSRHSLAAKILVAAGADMTLLAGGKSAGELAFKNGLPEVAALLGYVDEASGKNCETAPQTVLDEKIRAMLFMD